jgi:hypothetical protein
MSKQDNPPSIFEDLEGLNRRFLAIAVKGVPGPPAVAIKALEGLDERARSRLVGLPFAIFSFGFGADDDWEAATLRGVEDADPPPATDPARERFVLLALAFLRQAVRLDARRAAALAGIPASTGRWLGQLEFGCLAALAPAASGALRWRFAAQGHLWAGLVESCREPAGGLFPVLRAAGLQWTIRRALELGREDCTCRRGFRTAAR